VVAVIALLQNRANNSHCSTPVDRDGVVTQLAAQRSIRPRPHHSGRGLTCEPPRGIEPRTCSLRGGRTTPTMASTSDNSCTSHTFRCTSGTVRPEFAPRLIPRRTLVRGRLEIGQTIKPSTTGPAARAARLQASGPVAEGQAAYTSRHRPRTAPPQTGSRPRAGRSVLLSSCWTRSYRTHFPGAVAPVADDLTVHWQARRSTGLATRARTRRRW
jgi:hypothetical protein